jgi:segregation and condensation protein B
MSLKAKIEAVIYASEEPVTLSQLTGLLGQEAQAELDRVDAAQRTLSLNEGAEAGPAAVEETVGRAGEAEATGPDEQAEAAGPDPAGDGDAASGRADKARASRLRGLFRSVLDELIAEYSTADRGLEIREVAGGFRFATKPEYHDTVRGFVKSLKPPLKLSLQALETLAVVAYKQPVTAPEVSEIRGVESSGVLGSLMMRKLIATRGRKQVIGRPFLYVTTKEFLVKFGLKDLSELPSIEEFEKLAGQMAEQEEIPMGGETGQGEPWQSESGQSETERLESDGEEQPPEPLADEVIVDGRLSGLPPVYDDGADDPSAREAEEMQSAKEMQGAEGVE